MLYNKSNWDIDNFRSVHATRGPLPAPDWEFLWTTSSVPTDGSQHKDRDAMGSPRLPGLQRPQWYLVPNWSQNKYVTGRLPSTTQPRGYGTTKWWGETDDTSCSISRLFRFVLFYIYHSHMYLYLPLSYAFIFTTLTCTYNYRFLMYLYLPLSYVHVAIY